MSRIEWGVHDIQNIADILVDLDGGLEKTPYWRAKIQTPDIDQMHIGQQATLRFSALKQRYTPEVTGHFKTVAADLVNNPQMGESWYTARIQMKPEELAKLGNLSPLAGMSAEAYIKTSEGGAVLCR
ncbi:HlyD family secretion protein [Agrobacterium deltaense]|uniref:HlyD family secretion protein n=1 Tax=Agrobacterium deltaense TaxID=1183412 RepID=UPI003D95BBD0